MDKGRFALVICDIHPSTSGQAVVSRQVYDLLSIKYNIIYVPLSYTSREKRKSFILRFFFIFEFIFKLLIFLLKKSDKKIIYFTPSRGTISIYRDFLILSILKILKKNITKNKIKIFSHLHGSDMKKNYDKFFIKSFFKKIYNELNINIIILDEAHKNFALGENYKYYSIIPNFVKISDIKYSRIILDTRNEEFIKFKKNFPAKINFLHLSGVLKNKGLDFTIKLINKLNSDRNFINFKASFCLEIVGWKKLDLISMYPNLYKTVDKMEKNSSIKFHGKIKDNDDLKKVFSRTHFNILLSETEGQPLSLIEAASFGSLSIINNIDFIERLLLKIDGFLLERSDLKDCVLKVKKLINEIDDEYFNYKNCLIRNQKIKKIFSKDSFEKNIISIL